MGSELNVLLVEDNPGDARLIRELLRESGLPPDQVTVAASMEDAFRLVSAGGKDVVLLDLSLPGFSGLETFRAMHKHAPEIPILILTGTNDVELALRAVREGAQDYLVKGDIPGAVIVRAMRYAVERGRAEAEIKRLSHEIIRVQEEERNRISREIHDVIGQALVALKFQIENVAAQGVSAEEIKQQCSDIQRYINEILKEARELSHSLSPIALRRLGLNRAIEELIANLRTTREVEIHADLDDLETFFPDRWDINAYRIVQEALLNALKHSGASRIEIEVKEDENRLLLSVRDNGRGTSDPPPLSAGDRPGGLGTLIMHERAALMGGTVEIRNTNPGTEVCFQLERSRYRMPRGE